MSHPSIWSILGVEPTADPGEIRRAYAVRLKQTNPEDDAEGFQVLRHAYEAAIAQVRHRSTWEASRQAQAEQTESAKDASPIETFEVEPAAPARTNLTRIEASDTEAEPIGTIARTNVTAVEPEPEHEPRPDVVAEHGARCNRLAAALNQRAPEEVVLPLLNEVLTSPAMEIIAVESDTEMWLAQVVAHGGPEVEPLVGPAVERFAWHKKAQGWDLPPEILRALERNQELANIEQLAGPYSRFRHAYRLLQSSPGNWPWHRRLKLGRHDRQVGELLAALRKGHPGILARLDAEAITWWDKRLVWRLSPFRRFLIYISPLLLIWAFGAISATFGPPPPPMTAQSSPAPVSGRIGENLELHEAAERDLLRIQDPQAQAQIAVDRCRGQGRRGDLQQAVATCETYASMHGDGIEILNARAPVYLRLGRDDEARMDYEAVLLLSPNNARAMYGRVVAGGEPDRVKAWKAIVRARKIDATVDSDFAAYGLGVLEDVRSEKKVGPASLPPAEPPVRNDLPAGSHVRLPAMLSEPAQQELMQVYPRRARAMQVRGDVLMQCKITLKGRLDRCLIWSEKPQALGFGDAALSLKDGYRFTPLELNGRPEAGGQAVVALHFVPPPTE